MEERDLYHFYIYLFIWENEMEWNKINGMAVDWIG